MRTKNSSTAGTTPATKTARHPQVGMITSATMAARARPTGNDAAIEPVMRPRIRAGLNSAVSVSATGASSAEAEVREEAEQGERQHVPRGR